MIGSLRGRVLDRDPGSERSAACEVLLEVGGVGYRVQVTAGTMERLRVDDEAFLYIHHHVRENEIKVFGFPSKEERSAFESLLTVNGVGPSLALAVLATHPAPRLARILAEDDLNALCEVPGVGKKKAQMLLVVLRSSLVLPDDTGAGLAAGLEPADDSAAVTPLDDVREALVSLGYPPEQIRSVMAQVSAEAGADPSLDSGALVRLALRALAAA